LDLSWFEPNSMLHVHESRVERARNGEVKTGGEDRRVAVRSIDWPAPGQLPFLAILWTLLVSRRLENGSFTWLGRRKSLNTSPSLTLLMKQTHLLSVSFEQQAAGKLRLQGRAGRIDLAQILVVSIIMDAILPRSEPA
jgi:hypothetical protein